MDEISFPYIPIYGRTEEEGKMLTALADSFMRWAVEDEVVTTQKLTLIVAMCLQTMRRVFKLEELHSYLHILLLNVEWYLQNLDTQTRADGVEIPIVVAEDWRDMPEGFTLLEEILKGTPPETVPEEWLNDAAGD